MQNNRLAVADTWRVFVVFLAISIFERCLTGFDVKNKTCAMVVFTFLPAMYLADERRVFLVHDILFWPVTTFEVQLLLRQ